MPRKSTKKTEPVVEEAPKSGVNFFDYLRFGESYTSLILGIIVVIISSALLLSFVHNKNTNNQQNKNIAQGPQQNYQISTLPTLTPIQKDENPTATIAPTEEVKAPTATVAPTKAPKVTPTNIPTVAPTKVPTVMPTKKAEPTVAPKPAVTNNTVKGGEYVVKSGDTLWNIAEDHYKSGYNWVDIARVNNLSNPGMINAGNKLVLPKVIAKTPTAVAEKSVVTPDEQNNSTIKKAPVSNKITGNTYKIVHGDTLWDIAVRAYGDGYKWVDIARANGYANPSLIHADNVLKIPRGK